MMYEDEDEKPKFVLEFRAWSKPTGGTGAERPVWENRIDVGLKGVFEFGGFASLQLIQGSEDAYVRLVGIEGEPGMFRLYAFTNNPDPKKEIFEWWKPGDTPYRGKIRIQGHPWDARMVCTDLEVAMRIFREMFDHGDLSQATLSEMRSEWDPKPM